ncbi:hypothetical protein GCM10027280_20070 [Micromonospora polyrhachis]
MPRRNPAVTPSRARTSFFPDSYTFDTDSSRTAYDRVAVVEPGDSESVAVAPTSATRRLDGFLPLNLMRPTLGSASSHTDTPYHRM